MEDCNCKHKGYCKLTPDKCNVTEEWRHFQEDYIFGFSPEELAKMQGIKKLKK